jgi:hypothetical protein
LLGGAALLGSTLSKNKKSNNGDDDDNDDDGLPKSTSKTGFSKIMDKFLNVYAPISALASVKGLTTPQKESEIPKDIMEEIQNFKRLIK